jgi:hypothetical protein
MDGVRSLTEQLSDSANEFWSTVGSYLPKFFGALVLIVVGLVVAKLAQSVIEKVLTLIGINKLAKNKNVAKTLKAAEVNVDLVSVTGRVVFWVVILIFALTIADVLELTAMRDVIGGLLGYLPSVLAGAIVLTVTVGGARLVRDIVAASLNRMRVNYSHGVSTIVSYVIIVFGSLMALDQLGFDTTILSANVTVIVAGFVLALALAFGLGGRDVAGRMVEDMYSHFAKPNRKK